MSKAKNVTDEWDEMIILGPNGDLNYRVAFIQNIHDKTVEKINHFDKLRAYP
jgi:hypothetical protein